MTSIRTFGGGVRFWRPHKHPRDRNGRFIDTPDFYAKSVAYHPSSNWGVSQPWLNLPPGTRQDSDMTYPMVHFENGAPVLGAGWFDLPMEVRQHAFYAAASREAHLTIPDEDLEALFGDAPPDNILANLDITSLNGAVSRSDVIAEAYAILSDGDAEELDALIPGLAPLVRREALAVGMPVDDGVIAPPDIDDPRFAEGMAPKGEEVPEVPDPSALRFRDMLKVKPAIDQEILDIHEELQEMGGGARWKVALASGYVGDWGRTGQMANAFHENGVTLEDVKNLRIAVEHPGAWHEWLTGKGFVVESEGTTAASPVNLEGVRQTFPDLDAAYWGGLGQVADTEENRFRIKGTDGSVYRFPPFENVRDVTPEKTAERIARMVNPAIPVDHEPPLDADHWLQIAFLGKVAKDTSASRMLYRSAGFDTESVGGNATEIIGAEPLWDGLNAIGVAPEDADAMARTYAGLQASFPLHGFTGVAGLDHSVWKLEKAKGSALIAWTDPNGVVGIDPNGVRAQSLAHDVEPGFFAVPTAEGVITHEFAHNLFAGAATPQLYTPDRADDVASFALARANQAILDKHGIVSPWAAARRLSGYANVTPQEGHAELFNTYVHRNESTPEWVSTWGDAFVDGYHEALNRPQLPKPTDYYLELNNEDRISGLMGSSDVDRLSAIADHFPYARSLVNGSQLGLEDPGELTETARAVDDLIADRMGWTDFGPVSAVGAFYTGNGTMTLPFSSFGTTRYEVDEGGRNDFTKDSLDALSEVTVAMGGTKVEIEWPYTDVNDPVPNLDLSDEELEDLMFTQLGLQSYDGELVWDSNNLQDLFDNNQAVRDAAALRGDVQFKFKVADKKLLDAIKEKQNDYSLAAFEPVDTTIEDRQMEKMERVYGEDFRRRVQEEKDKLGDTPPLIHFPAILDESNVLPTQVYSDVFEEKFMEHWNGSGVMKDGRPFHWESAVHGVTPVSIDVRSTFIDDTTGQEVGKSQRILQFAQGRVNHELLEFDGPYQGQGMGYQYNRENDAWYLANGLREIKVHAALTEGGYAWASDFFEFDTPAVLDGMFKDISASSNRIIKDKNATKSELISALQAQIDLDFFEDRVNTTGQEVSAWETAHIGWHPEVAADRNWIGRKAMAGTEWYGTKPLAALADIDVPTRADYKPGTIKMDTTIKPGSSTWGTPGDAFLNRQAKLAMRNYILSESPDWELAGRPSESEIRHTSRARVAVDTEGTDKAEIVVKTLLPPPRAEATETMSEIGRLLRSWGTEVNSKSGNSKKWKSVSLPGGEPGQAEALAKAIGDGATVDEFYNVVRIPLAPGPAFDPELDRAIDELVDLLGP